MSHRERSRYINDAAAALLSLLGVPRDEVIADFMRTNEYTLSQFRSKIDEFAAAGGERYFSEGLGIDSAGQLALRELYIEH